MKYILAVILSFLLSSPVWAAMKGGPKWFEGSVEEAFKESEKLGKPLFIYWGAVWCPPCNQIKKTIFTKSEFISEAQNFINIYLDGDLPAAQKWGDHFGTVGYPTMMILSPKGQELYRMPYGLQAPEYAALMKSVRQGMQDIGGLLTKKRKTKLEWDILAKHSWGQEKNLSPDFYELARSCEGTYCDHFFLNAISAESERDKSELRHLEYYQAGLVNFLKDPTLVSRNLEFAIFAVDEVLEKFFAGAKREEVAKLWSGAVSPLIDNTNLTLDDRLSSLLAVIKLQTMNGQKVSEKLQGEVRRKVAWADMNAKDQMERQAVMSTAVYLLMSVDLLEEAKTLALKELKKSNAPYYFMSYLASIEKKQQHNEASLNWSRQAWQSATGSATRFQWATSYLIDALKFKKFEEREVQNDYKNILAEVLAEEDAFSGRNRARFKRLIRALNDLSPQGLAELRASCEKNQKWKSALAEVEGEAAKKS